MKFSVECGRTELAAKLFRYGGSTGTQTTFGSPPASVSEIRNGSQIDTTCAQSVSEISEAGSGQATINKITSRSRQSSVRFTLPVGAKQTFDCFGEGKPCDYHASFARAQERESRRGSMTPR